MYRIEILQSHLDISRKILGGVSIKSEGSLELRLVFQTDIQAIPELPVPK
jgi:hypothetical protein